MVGTMNLAEQQGQSAFTDYEWLEPLIRSDLEPDDIYLTVLTDMASKTHAAGVI